MAARRRPCGRPFRVEGRRGGPSHDAGKTKVHHDRPPRSPRGLDHDVVGLEIPVHQSLGVRRRETSARLHEQRHDGRPRTCFVVEPPGQGLATNELHRDVDSRTVGPHIVHSDHVGVRHPGHGLSLTQQLVGAAGIAGVGQQELERQLAIELGIVRCVHDPHPSCAEPPEHEISPYDVTAIQRTSFGCAASSSGRSPGVLAQRHSHLGRRRAA